MKCRFVRYNPFSYTKKVHMACMVNFVLFLSFAKKGICENLTLNVVSMSQITFVYIPQRSYKVTRLLYFIRGVVYPIGHHIWLESNTFMAGRWCGQSSLERLYRCQISTNRSQTKLARQPMSWALREYPENVKCSY